MQEGRREAMNVPKKVVVGGILGGALVLGGATGSLFVGPKILSARGIKTASKPVEAKTEEKIEAGIVYEIENVIVNPAGSQGVHFLMITVAFEVPDQKAEEALRGNDVKVRDTVIATLERETMEMLVEPGARERLKEDLKNAVAPLNGGAKWMEVYLPQYVIQ
jgi:flagellar basal body-associated protein FliL